MFLGRWTALALLMVGGTAAAQRQEPARGNPSLTALVGGVRSDAARRELRPRRFDLDLRARGAVATGEVTVSFAYPGPETVEGDFRLALPADAVVTGYALDVGGRMIDGVLVDRPRAKAVYEARVRQRIDPGLAEVAPDGTFRTRVFPIGPQGRTVRVRFAAPIGPTGLRLPIQLARPTEGWSIAVRAEGGRAAPTLVLPGLGLTPMRAQQGSYQARAEGGTEPLDGDLVLGAGAPPDTLASRHATGERYLQLSGDLPATRAIRPERVRIYWDRSRSRIDDRIDAELGVVRHVLERWRPATIELVAFNSSAAQRFTASTPAAAAERLRGLRYLGATSLAGIGGEGAADRCLLVSDGAVTIDRAARFRPACPLDAITSSAGGDAAWLRHLATQSGGRLHTLAGAAEAQVAEAIAAMPPAVTGVADAAGRLLPFATMSAPTGRWTVLAQAPDAGGVTVSLTGGGRIARAAPVEAPAFDGEGALVGRERLATLGATDQRSGYVDVSRRYAIASPSLPFLVLETPADYVEADVAPPASFPADLRAGYEELTKAAAATAARQKASRMDVLVARWRERVAWWERRFEPPTPEQLRKRAEAAGERDGTDIVVTASAVRPGSGSSRPSRRPPAEAVPSPPAPPPPPAPVVMAPVPPAPAEPGEATAAVQIDAWQPDRPYLKLYDADPAGFDTLFEEQQRLHGSLPAFYLDTAEWLRRRGRTDEAAEMVLAALEPPSADDTTLGIVAARLERYGAIDRAVELRERHAALDPTRPQPRRLLALALGRRAAQQPDRARGDLERAVALLGAVAADPLDPRWRGIDMIALNEANAMLARSRRLGGRATLDPRLVGTLDADIRVVVDWTTDATDLDLLVVEPSGERVFYGHQRSGSGGHLSEDMTRGYGPEEYWIRRAPSGDLAVAANVFAADRLDPNGPSLVQARLIRDWGRPSEREEAVDIELVGNDRGERRIGRIVVP